MVVLLRASHGSPQMYQTINYKGLFGICGLRINLAVFMCRPSREKAASGSSRGGGKKKELARARRKHRFQIESRLTLEKRGDSSGKTAGPRIVQVWVTLDTLVLVCWTSFVFGTLLGGPSLRGWIEELKGIRWDGGESPFGTKKKR